MRVPAAVINWLRTRSRSLLRLRVGSFFVLLACGWPMILPLLLSLSPDYIEFEFNSLPALIWVWFPSGAMLGNDSMPERNVSCEADSITGAGFVQR